MQPEDKDGCVPPEQEVSWPLTTADNVYVSLESLLELLLISHQASLSFFDLSFPVSSFVLLLLLIHPPSPNRPTKGLTFLPPFCFPFPHAGCALTVALWVKEGEKREEISDVSIWQDDRVHIWH